MRGRKQKYLAVLLCFLLTITLGTPGLTYAEDGSISSGSTGGSAVSGSAILATSGSVLSTGGAAAVSGSVITPVETTLENGMLFYQQEGANANALVETNHMVVEELSASEGFGSSGMVDVAFVVIPVKVSGNYKITADVTIDEHYNTGTTGGLFLGVYDSYEKEAAYAAMAVRGDNSIKMYRQKASGTSYGGSGDSVYTAGDTVKLELFKTTKFYTELNDASYKNSSDVPATLLSDTQDVYIGIAFNGVKATIENLLVTSEDGTTVYYDQASVTVLPKGPVEVTESQQQIGNLLYVVGQSGTAATVEASGTSMTIDETSSSGGISGTGMAGEAFVYIPVKVSGEYIISADVSILSNYNTGTGAGVYVSAFDGFGQTSAFVSMAVRGDGSIKMYRQKASGTGYGGSGDSVYTAGSTVNLKLYKTSKFYTELDGSAYKNSSDVPGSLSGSDEVYVGIIFQGVKATVTNLLVTNSDGSVVYYDQNDVSAVPGDDTTRKDWSAVTSPVLGTITQSAGDIIVPFTMEIGDDGADKVSVTMKDSAGNEVSTQQTASSGTSSFTFTAEASGSYSFTAMAWRTEEETEAKISAAVSFDYVLLLSAPVARVISTKYEDSGATISAMKVIWEQVAEADSYDIFLGSDYYGSKTAAAGEDYMVVESPSYVVGTSYDFTVVAVRGADSSSTTISGVYRDMEERDWQFATFGASISSAYDIYSGNVFDGLTLSSTNGKGKFTSDGYDGIAFYYTKVDATSENFILNAKVTVDSWTLSNGQEGFGLLVRDSIGADGDSGNYYYSNSVGIIASKVEYYWDDVNNCVTDDSSMSKITMKIGLGARVITGIQDTFSAPGSGSLYAGMATLDTSRAVAGAGEHNLIGNETSGNVKEAGSTTVFYLTLQKSNTGYHCIYKDAAGNVIAEEIMYDPDELLVIDPDNVYVGFAAARNCSISISDIEFTTSDPATDPAAQERPVTYVTPSYEVTSPATTGTSDYNFVFRANADGILTVTSPDGTELFSDVPVTAGAYISQTDSLLPGTSTYSVTFTPNASYVPGAYSKLSSYDSKTFSFTVTYKKYGTAVGTIYVSPDGTAYGTGSSYAPVDIYTAVAYAVPGQIIILKADTYDLTKSLYIARGTDGTAANEIIMVSDPSSTDRAILDFGKIASGMQIWGNYWHFKGFDVTNSANGQKGIQLSGSNCTLDDIRTYNNGNTGLQISGTSTEPFSMWPSNNLILNCTSFNNADAGYEDADGFAAKLTCGDGNRFVGCISYNNADDGWDLFAKVATGQIGSVTIESCVAFNNGYLLDGTNAGNGNGFKLGGTSILGNHVLSNCIAWGNKAKGIDSNSCPDINVLHCTSFNNGSYNVALYTNTAANTAFTVLGVLSFRTVGTDISEQLKPAGTQSDADLKSDLNFYWLNGSSVNKSGATADASWFSSLATEGFIPGRLSDGTIDMKGILEITKNAPAGVGGVLFETASLPIEIPKEPEPTAAPAPIVTASPEPTVTTTPEAEITPIPEAEVTTAPEPTQIPEELMDTGTEPVPGAPADTQDSQAVDNEGALDNSTDVDIPEDETAESGVDALPQTGVLPSEAFYLTGTLLAGAGYLIRKKKKPMDE